MDSLLCGFPVSGHNGLPNATLISHAGILIAIMPYLRIIATPNIIIRLCNYLTFLILTDYNIQSGSVNY